MVQGERTLALTTDGYSNVEELKAAEAPSFREIGVFTLRDADGFDPLRPWRLDVRLPDDLDEEDEDEPTIVSLTYELPERYRVRPAQAEAVAGVAAADAAEQMPLWQEIWLERSWRIAGVALMLLVLTGLLVFQKALVDRPVLYRRVRLAFLAVTLIWLGWFAGAQLSVVNVLTFSHALMGDFAWTSFLAEPLIFILWCYTAVALLFLGRGVFCGWLCPFGALQALANRIARRLRVPQVQVPFGLHERLWPIKYVIFLALFALSLTSMTDAFVAAEVEPFKTAISLHFVRDWPFVAYAVRAGCRQPVHQPVLLPLPLPARRGTGHPGAAAHVRLAEAPSSVRPRVPDLLSRLPRAGDPPRRQHQSQRVHPLPEVPVALPGRDDLPAAGRPPQAPRAARGAERRARCLHGGALRCQRDRCSSAAGG